MRVVRVKAGSGLVVENYLGIHDDASGDAYAALHAAAQIGRE